jgi:hypothetical protein
LRPGLLGDFAIDVLRGRLDVRRRRRQVTDALEKIPIAGHIANGARVSAMPRVELLLQPVSLRQQRAVFRRQLVDQRREPFPKVPGVDAGTGQQLVRDEAIEVGRDVQTVPVDAFTHPALPLLRAHSPVHCPKHASDGPLRCDLHFNARRLSHRRETQQPHELDQIGAGRGRGHNAIVSRKAPMGLAVTGIAVPWK